MPTPPAAAPAGFADTTGLSQTTHATPNAIAITVNTSAGGTGNASIDNITADSGTLNVSTFGGSILYAGTNTLTTFQLGVSGNGGTAPTRLISADNFTFTTANTAGATGSVGTAARPLQINALNGSTLTANSGDGGVFAVDWGTAGSVTLSLAGASATGAGNILVVTANAGGHNLTVTGPVTAVSGNILLAADDTFVDSAPVGGAGFSGQVYFGANRDQGNTGTLTMTGGVGSITTSNATANAVLLEDYGGVTGTVNGILTLGNISVGNGGTITATTVPTLGTFDPAAPTSNGQIIAGTSSVVLNAGANGTVVLTAAATTGTTDTAGIGTAATPIVVSAGTVNVTNTSSIDVPTDSVYVTGNSSTAFNATVAGTQAGSTNLSVTSGNLIISGASTVGGARSTLPTVSATSPSAGLSAPRPPAPSLSTREPITSRSRPAAQSFGSNDPVTITAGKRRRFQI